MGRAWGRPLLVVLAALALGWDAALAQPPAPPPAPPPGATEVPPPGVTPPGQAPSPAQPPAPPPPPAPGQPPVVLPPPVLTPPAVERGPTPLPTDPSIPTPPGPTIPSGIPFPLPPLQAVAARPGPLFELHPFVTLSEEYTDNFRLTADDKEENFRTSLAPGLTLVVRGARTTAVLSGSVAVSHDTITDEVRAVLTGVLGGELAYEVTPRLRLRLSDFFTRSDEPTLSDRLGLRRERSTFLTNTLTASADWLIGRVATREYYRWTTFFDSENTQTHALGASASTLILPRTTLSAGYEHLRTDTDTAQGDLVGHEFTASVGRSIGNFASAGVSGSYAIRSSADGTGSTVNDFTRWSAAVFGSYGLPGRWSLSASLGYAQVEPDRGRTFSGITSTATLSYFFARAVASLTYEQGFSETFATGENFGVVETRGLTASLSAPLTVAITGIAQAFYRENEFTGVGGGPANTTEQTWGGSLGFSVQLLRWLNMGLDYTHRRISASARGGEISENLARLSLTAAF
jgi:hypothetical protein